MRALFRIHVALTVALLAPAVHAAEWDHVHLLADNTPKAADWYIKHFGGEKFKSGPFDAIQLGKTVIKFKRGNNHEGSEGSVVDHIGFSVKDVAAKVKALEADGCTVTAPAKRLDAGGFSYAFLVDPWGTKLEILDDPEMTGFHHVHLKTEDPASTLKWFHATFGGKTANFRDLEFLPGIRWGEMWLLVLPSREPVAPNVNRAVEHIGWKTKEMDATWNSIQEQKLKVHVPLTTSGDHQLLFVESPEGVKIEVQDYPK